MAMKKINVILVAALAAIVSCTEKPEVSEVSDKEVNLVPMTFRGVAETAQTKTTYKGRAIYWEETDAVSVFFKGSDNVAKQTFTAAGLSSDKTSAYFEGTGVENSESFVAVYPDAETNAYDGINLTVSIPSVQTGVLNGFASGVNTSVAVSNEDTLLFRNVGSLVGFRFSSQEEADLVSSVTLRAVSKISGYLGLTGSSTVALQEGVPAAGEGNTDYVTVTAPEGGFKAGTSFTYYAVVYPFDCAGFEVTLTHADGTEVVKTNSSPAVVLRSEGLALNTLPSAKPLPAEFEVNFDFTAGWPFNESIVKAANQQTSGSGDKYTYLYNYKVGDKTYSLNLHYYIFGGTTSGAYKAYSYGYTPAQLRTSGGNTRIYIPGIAGTYLKLVELKVNNGSAKSMELVSAVDWSLKADGVGALNTAPGVFEFPRNGFTPEEGTPYYLRIKEANSHILGIRMVYAKVVSAAQ